MRLHALGWLHCDIKPEQFLCDYVDHNWYVYFVDFGSAISIEDATNYPAPDCLTTAPYAAKEVYRNYEKLFVDRQCYNQSADVYALGITIAEIFYNMFYESWLHVLNIVKGGTPASTYDPYGNNIQKFVSSLPASVKNIVSSMVQIESKDRCFLEQAESEMGIVVCAL